MNAGASPAAPATAANSLRANTWSGIDATGQWRGAMRDAERPW